MLSHLSGSVLIPDGVGALIIVDWGQIPIPSDYLAQQISIPDMELGDINAGIMIDIDLPEDAELSVYGRYYNGVLAHLWVDLENWMPPDSDFPVVKEDLTTDSDSREVIGSIAVYGGAILVTEETLSRLCLDYIDSGMNQITAPPEGEEGAFKVGVHIPLPSDLYGRELPVYGLYTDARLLMLMIDLIDME